MKPNSLSIFFILILAVLFFNCSNKKEKSSSQDEQEEMKRETERHLAEKTARVKWPWVEAEEFPVDSLDIRIDDLSTPELELSFDIVKDSVFILTEEEFNIARELVKKHFAGIVTSISDNSIEDSYKPVHYNYYFKQYIGYKDHERKKKLVYVNMFRSAQTPNGWANQLKNMWLIYYDRGKSAGIKIVDVENKVVL
jgi:hypothetical protein